MPPATTVASRAGTGAAARARSGPEWGTRRGAVAGGREAQAALAALDPRHRGDRPRLDREHWRAAAPHPFLRASAIRYAIRLCSEYSSMKPGAAPCENEASALNVARLRS